MRRALVWCSALAALVGCASDDMLDGGTSTMASADTDSDTGDELQCFTDELPDTPAFELDVWPTLADRCSISSCHKETVPPLMPDAAGTYDNLVGVPAAAAMLDYVTPGSPDESYLWHKLSGTQATVPGGGGATMPVAGLELCADDLQAIEAWISSGAVF